jgi:hypothetical protein
MKPNLQRLTWSECCEINKEDYWDFHVLIDNLECHLYDLLRFNWALICYMFWWHAINLTLIILVEDILLCLKYIVTMKLNVYSVRHNYLFILLFLLLATSFGFNRPSAGQYLQKHTKFLSFCKYWPADGLLKTKLVTNSRNIKIKR